MQVSANTLRVGNIIEHNNGLWTVAKTPMHVKPGKGPAYVQVEMKNVRTGNKLNERFSSSENVEKIRLDEKSFQFLYLEDNDIVLMDNETFDQIHVPQSMLDEKLPFLSEGLGVMVEFYYEEALSIMLPETIALVVAEAEPVVKGQTAASSYKTAILENGLRIMVPPFIEAGDKLIVRTEDITYVERAK